MVEKDNDDYQSGKNKCSNRTGHYIERSPNPEKWKYYFMVQLLTISQNFIKSIYDSKKHIFGKGVYFTDMLDYEWTILEEIIIEKIIILFLKLEILSQL
jgi:hypothetical protein